MRILLFLSLIICFSAANAQEAQQQQNPDAQKKPAASNAAPLRQPDGSLIHIVGAGNVFVSYTETTDGYTIVMAKDGIYQYATLNNKGDLVPDGTNAHDPDNRSAKEEKYLLKTEKHLRYQNPKLQELLDHQKKFELSPIKKKNEK